MTSPETDLHRLGTEFWEWRAVNSFRSGDDIPRIERPPGWLPRFDPESVARQRRELRGFVERWRAMDASGWPVPAQIDHRLLGSALARVHWELDVLRIW
jgi:hypothetical protein